MSSKKKAVVGLLLAALILGALIVQAAPVMAAGNDIYFSAPYYLTPGDNPKGYVEIGETFYVDIIFEQSTPTRGGGAGFDFDPALVQVNSVTEGTFYSSLGLPTFCNPAVINNAAGTVRNFAVVYLGGYPQGQTGIGVFATVQMQALANGVSTLTFAPFPQTGMGDIDANELWPTLHNSSVQVGPTSGPVTVDLRVTGIAADIVNVTGYTVPEGTVIEDGITIDNQTVLGALVNYCQANSIPVEVTDAGWGAYVMQIGTDSNDENSWSYALNGHVPMVGAADQPVSSGDRIHWFNYTLGYYSFTLEVDPTSLDLNDPVTFTVTWTDGNGAISPVEHAEVFVSDTMGTWGPEPGTSYGYTNSSGQLTLVWSQLGTFYPYAEHSVYGSTQYQWPTPQFTCSSTTAGTGDTILHGQIVPQLELTVPADILTGWLLHVGVQNEAAGTMNVKSNAPWQCTVVDGHEDGTGSLGLMTQYDVDAAAYGSLSLGDPLHVIGDGNDVTLTAGIPVIIAEGIPADQLPGNAGETVPLTFRQYVEYDDPVLEAPYDVYRIVITFTASQTI